MSVDSVVSLLYSHKVFDVVSFFLAGEAGQFGVSILASAASCGERSLVVIIAVIVAKCALPPVRAWCRCCTDTNDLHHPVNSDTAIAKV